MLSYRSAKTLQRPFYVVSRCFASAASAPLTDPLQDDTIIPPKKPRQDGVKVSKLANGINVASVDSGCGVSRVAVAVKAGSRFENKSQLGLSHLLKNSAFLTNGGRTHLRTVREVQQTGGSLDCSGSRELISRNGTCLRNSLPEMMENIAPGVTSPLFNKWEFHKIIDQCHGEIATQDPSGLNLEHLHKVAFRDGLGNSIYCSDVKVESYSAEDMQAFVNQHHVGGSITVCGTDVDHDELVRYSTDLLGGLPSGSSSTAIPQKYHGGELHLSTSNGFSYASLVGAGVGLSNADLPAFAVLQRILGYGTCIKWGTNTVSSRLNRAVQSIQEPCVLSSLNISYSDAGLFGIHAISTPTGITSALRAAVNELTAVSSGDISAEDIELAKKQVKSNVLMVSESADSALDDLVKQVAFTGKYVTPAEVLKKVDAVTAEKVVEISTQLLNGNLTLVATGDSSTSSYLDELI